MKHSVKSPKELSLEKKILAHIENEKTAHRAAELLIHDSEVNALQDYANTVSIVRLGYNDHGPVHMRTVALNAIHMMFLLREAGIEASLEHENAGTFEDSLTAVIFASFLHDVGMTVGRQDHEFFSSILAFPIIDRLLGQVYPDNISQRCVVRSLTLEGIIGHMGGHKIHSLEAGIILVADGCDMKKGRARIPMTLSTEPKVGDIHKYSANSIEAVTIMKGAEKPLRIEILMSSDVGFFQIEEVLIPKIDASPARKYIELLAGTQTAELKQYL
ncbi:phosphohydrolase [Brucepastera parasyntrophica]|uniref:phosphohydrolase n=1 Tax=Brucepastera parasyntrophica TaxID=2880008 RepID=UPI0021088343|nr:phosphohydrolase [Brucepastera parasyntrophica]ULQ59347.1 phosphohydrolase [Brucepastera parasyntrophica]